MPRVENKLANLQCNNCEQRFVAPVQHEAIEDEERGVTIWVPAKRSASHVRCPWCGSGLIEFQD